MSKFIVKGGERLKGEVKLSGNKNSALKLIPAALLSSGVTILNNLPRIRDVEVMVELINKLGAKSSWLGGNSLRIDAGNLNSYQLDADLSARIRASVVLAAPLLVKFGRAVITPPGGDQIGERLLDTHFEMLKSFGVELKRENGKFFLEWKNRKPSKIFLEESSVTATEMGIMMASGLDEETTIDDAAAEPHVEDLANFVSKMGVKVFGGGTNSLRILGKKKLVGTEHKVVPDHIEGGTYAITSAITNGNIVIKDYVPEHYRMILYYLRSMGVNFKEYKDKLEVLPSDLKATKRKFQTRPWPGFPTDLMSPFIVLATQTQGMVLCHDWMYEWRMFFVDDLISMGANILIADPHRVIINGPTKLFADRLFCKDIRAGISVILAALVAEGESVVENVEMVERGYENIQERLSGLGAKIRRENDSS